MRTKPSKKSSATVTVAVDFGQKLLSLTNITTIAGITISAGALISITTTLPDGNSVGPGYGVQFTVAGGADKTEYLITITAVADDGSGTIIIKNFVLIISNIISDSIGGVQQVTLSYYGSYLLAANYFLTNTDWTGETVANQLISLVKASRAIDVLNFSGLVTLQGQPQQFPRTWPPDIGPWPLTAIVDQSITSNPNYDIPDDVINATYEEALSLIQGNDASDNILELPFLSKGIGSARVTYDRSFALPNLRAGITSPTAWALLQPYLQDVNDLTLNRVT